MNRFAMSTLLGAVVLFFGGWVIWGVLLAGFFAGHTNTDAMLDPPIWWALILQQVFFAALLTLVVQKWTNSSGWQAGAKLGALVGILIGFGVDLGMYSMTTLADLTATLVDPFAMAAYMALGGAAIGWFSGRATESRV